MSVEQGWPGLAQYTPAAPADWSPRPRTVQDALDQLGARGGGAGAAASFVWRPLGVAAPGVYATWPTLAAAMDTLDPASLKIVSVDDSLGAAHITAGAFPGCDNIEFRSGGADAGPGGAIANVIVDEGASLTGTVAHLALTGCNLTYDGATGAFISPAANRNFVLSLEESSVVGSNAGGDGLVSMGAGGELSVNAKLSTLGGQLVAGTATSGAVFLLSLSSLAAGTVQMTAGASVVVEADGASVVSATQSPAPSIVIVDPTPSFVFRPGGTAGGIVYTSDQALKEAIAQCPGPRTVLVDDALAAAHFTGAGWDLDNVTLLGNQASTTFTLHLDTGFSFTSTSLSIASGLSVSCECAASPWVPTTFSQLSIEPSSALLSKAGAAPFLAVTNAGAAGMQMDMKEASSLGDGTHNVVTVGAGLSLFLVGQGPGTGGVAAHAFGGLGHVTVDRESSFPANVTQDVSTFTVVNQSLASQVAYTPGVAGNWNPAPTVSNAALDQLAAPNFVQTAGNTGTGTGTVSAVTGNLAKKKSGTVQVSGTVSGVISGAGTVTASLLRDATPIGHGVPYVALATATGFSISVDFIDTLPDTANHTYTVQAVAGAGTIATAANGAQIQAQEF